MASEPRASIATRVVLTLLGVAVTSLALLASVALLSDAADGARRAAWRGLAAFVVMAVSAWLTLWAASARNPFARPIPGRARAQRRLIVARGCLLLSATLLLFFLLALPFPPRWRDATAGLTLLAELLAALYAAVTLTHAESSGRHVAIVLGAVMTSQLVWSTFSLSRALGNPDAGPAPVLAFLAAWTCLGCAILAALCVLSLRGDWPPRNPAPAGGVVS